MYKIYVFIVKWIKRTIGSCQIIKPCHLMYVKYFRTCIVKLESKTLNLNILSEKPLLKPAASLS